MNLVKAITVLAVLATAQLGVAKPILNRTVALASPVFEPIHPDSENPNIYWIHQIEFSICGLDDGRPAFTIQAFKLGESPRTFVTFDLCAKQDQLKVDQYRQLLWQMNPNAQLKFLEAFYAEAPTVEFATQKDFGITVSCSGARVTEPRFSCGAFAIGEHRADRLYNYFRWTRGLLSAQYLKYGVNGVEQDDRGNLNDVFREYSAIVYVSGLAAFPDLFKTSWQP